MPENHRTPQTTSGILGKLQTAPELSGKLQDTAEHGWAGSKTAEQQCMFFSR